MQPVEQEWMVFYPSSMLICTANAFTLKPGHSGASFYHETVHSRDL